MGKLARWVFILQEYDFDVRHRAMIVDKDVDGLNRNPSASDLDTIGARWHGEIDLEIVFGWHVFSFLCTLANGCQEVLC